MEKSQQAKKVLAIMAHSMEKVSEMTDSVMMNANATLAILGMEFDDEDLVMLEQDCYDIKFRADACARFLREKSK